MSADDDDDEIRPPGCPALLAGLITIVLLLGLTLVAGVGLVALLGGGL